MIWGGWNFGLGLRVASGLILKKRIGIVYGIRDLGLVYLINSPKL